MVYAAYDLSSLSMSVISAFVSTTLIIDVMH